MNPTIVGILAIVIWGIALPVIKVVQETIGLVATTGLLFSVVSLMGIVYHVARRRPFPDKAIFRNPYLYARWFFYLVHEIGILTGICMVQKQHMPFLILINYLWPTAIIICSVMFAGVKISRWWAFILGSIVVLASMSIEILGPNGFAPDIFASGKDCLAYLVVFAGAVGWGMYSMLSRRNGTETGGATLLPLFQLSLGIILPLSFLPGMATWGNLHTGPALLMVGYCFLQFLAYPAWDYGMREGNVVLLSLFADFIPWLSLLTATLILGVDIGDKTVLSAVSLVMGAMITRYGTLQKRPVPAAYEQPDV